MIRGEFIRGDGKVMPNNITTLGAEMLLAAALRAVTPTLYMGLCNGVFTPGMLLAAAGEPTIGTNGYARQQLVQGVMDWPTVSALNGEPYVESKAIVFAPTGAGFAVSRCFIASASTAGNVLMLGSALEAQETLLPATDVALRTFRYRLYLR